MPGSSWARWTSRTWTSSRDCPRPSPSTRSPRRGTPGQRWAPSPRCTTTSGSSMPASASPTVPTAAGRWPVRAPSRSWTAFWPWTRAPGSWSWPRWSVAGRGSTAPSSTTWPNRDSPGPGWTGRPWSWPSGSIWTWPGTNSTPSRWSSTAWSAGTTSAVASPSRSRPPSPWPRAWPRWWWSIADGSEEEAITFSQHLACTYCALSFEDPSPRNFSFNSPYGACPACTGLGTRFEVDPELVVPDPTKSLAEGALAPWAGARSEYFARVVTSVAELGGFSVDAPWEKLRKSDKKLVLYGAGGRQVHLKYRNRYGRQRSFHTAYEGIVPWLQRRHSEADSEFLRDNLEDFLREVPCPECGGARLRPESLAVTVGGYSIFALCSLSIGTAVDVVALARPLRPGPPHRRPGVPRGARANAVPVGRGARLPDPGPLGHHPVGRRGPAHPTGQPDRQRSGRSALRPGRAVHRAPPAGQQAAHRDPQAAPRPGQHRDRGRARRGDHPGGRPRGRRGARGRGARGTDRPLRTGDRPGWARVQSPTR